MLILDYRHKSFIILKFLIILIACCILFSQLSIVSAAAPGYLNDMELSSLGFTSYEYINPNLLVYPLKRINEKLKLKLLINREQKREYAYKLYEIRLKELVYIVNNKKEGFLTLTADRYNSFVGILKTEFPVDEQSRSKFESSIKLLERLRDIYPANSPNWDKLQQTVDTTRSLI